ncbi:hypothetical protein LTR08_006269 [Meristemomyces frigidus]|nr:hypothetical protein LTR08_006269 [Meristemomyces frigidus]
MSNPNQPPPPTDPPLIRQVLRPQAETQRQVNTAQPPVRAADPPSPLLGLSPELRNIVYGYVFEDNAPPTVNVFRANREQPSLSLALTSHGICNEVVGLYSDALLSFWGGHTFELITGVPPNHNNTSAGIHMASASPMATLFDTSADPAFNPPIRKLTVKHYRAGGQLLKIKLEAVSPFNVVQTNPMQPGPGFQMGWWSDLPGAAAHYHNIDCYDTSRPGYIDVYNVLRAVSCVQGGNQPSKQAWIASRASLRSTAGRS